MMGKEIILAKGLTKCFGNFTAVKSIDFTVNKGDVFGLLGANGAGKTTTIKMLCGLLKPSSGKLFVIGLDIYNQSQKIKENIGYMSQKFSLYNDLSINENITFWGGVYGINRKELIYKRKQIIEQLHLQSQQNKKVKDLSLGQKQQLAFAVAIIHKPKIVFLDEPTSGVSPITRRRFWEMIYKYSELGVTFLITTHHLEEAEYCNKIAVMVAGKIKVIGSPNYLKQQYNKSSINELFIFLTGEVLK